MEEQGIAAGAAETALAATLTSLHLKTVVKEHHAKPVGQVMINTVDAGKQNLFATVAHNQASVLRCGAARRPARTSSLTRSSCVGNGV